MNYLLAFDKYKGALTALEAAQLAAGTIAEIDPAASVELAPLTDGGEGFATILAAVLDGELHEVQVPGPRFDPVTGRFALVESSRIPGKALERLKLDLTGKIAFVEMASASGYECLDDDQRDPWKTTTIGTGQLMRAAVEAGAEAIILGIGGSATNDCGAGALEALGVHYYDINLQAIEDITPEAFRLVTTVGSTSHLMDKFPPVRIACDVTNPLLGENGATSVFGPQKGLKPEDRDRMERTIGKMAKRLLGLFGKAPVDWDDYLAAPGTGAAGGIGFALLHALPDTAIVEGFPLIAELMDLQNKISHADVVMTGEGRLDESSLGGKGPVGVVRMSSGVDRVILLAGSMEPAALQSLQAVQTNLEGCAISDPEWPLAMRIARNKETLPAAIRKTLA
jgi:glycerate kinase